MQSVPNVAQLHHLSPHSTEMITIETQNQNQEVEESSASEYTEGDSNTSESSSDDESSYISSQGGVDLPLQSNETNKHKQVIKYQPPVKAQDTTHQN